MQLKIKEKDISENNLKYSSTKSSYVSIDQIILLLTPQELVDYKLILFFLITKYSVLYFSNLQNWINVFEITKSNIIKSKQMDVLCNLLIKLHQ